MQTVQIFLVLRSSTLTLVERSPQERLVSIILIAFQTSEKVQSYLAVLDAKTFIPY